MGAVWSALLVGGGLAGALFVWLLRDTGKKRDAKQEKDASLGEAVAAGGDQGDSGGLRPGNSRQELITKPGILPPGVPSADLLERKTSSSQRWWGEGEKAGIPPGAFLMAHSGTASFPSAGQDAPHAPHLP